MENFPWTVGHLSFVHLQGDNKVAGQAFLALWAKRTRILKKCKYVSKDKYLSFKKC